MFKKVISKDAENCLAILSKSQFINDFYLGGGTAMALQLGHRISNDLDFFSQKEFNTKILIQKIKKLGKFSVRGEEWGTLYGEFQKTKITFFYYPYPLLFPIKKFKGIKIADMFDIACMKIDAISSRGIKKDFVDLYFMSQKKGLPHLLKLFEKKYKSVNYNTIHILKSLVYFEDARRSPMPKMIKKCSWKNIERYFQKEVEKMMK